jgi:hypothetical protein
MRYGVVVEELAVEVMAQRALELSAPTSTMTRTLLNIDAAACSHHEGDTSRRAAVRSRL